MPGPLPNNAAAAGIQRIATPELDIAYHAFGPQTGRPVLLLHGFPYSPHACFAAARMLAAEGERVIAPYLRGFGPTRFLDQATPRSGEQAALGMDLIALIEALRLDQPIVAGFDWGGRAACVAAAIRPDLVRGLVTCGGYNIFGPPVTKLLPPEVEHVLWYQYFLHTTRGEEMLETNRRGFCRLLWSLWSPGWQFKEADFEAAAACFDNPDFVAVVLHSYRHRAGLVAGDPALEELSRQLEAERPPIAVPAVALYGNGGPLGAKHVHDADRFAVRCSVRTLPGVGHNVMQEAPQAMADAVRELLSRQA